MVNNYMKFEDICDNNIISPLLSAYRMVVGDFSHRGSNIKGAGVVNLSNKIPIT